MVKAIFRSATAQDCAELALFADMATRGLNAQLWALASAPGQSAFEFGRNLIRNDTGHSAWFGNWRVAEAKGVIVGAANSHVLAVPQPTNSAAAELVRGLNDLKIQAAGSWYIASAALHSEYQGQKLGELLLADAEALARSGRNDRLTIMVGSFNDRARRLYERFGFTESARRPFKPFPGSDPSGEWILMEKHVA